jgi:L,D-peptidoglycan transpeptidase YkuD (ErfK/YbiS/YcfS/YnhG family)
MRDLVVENGSLRVGALNFRCAIGRGGVVPASAKREGDGATPAGRLALRPGFFRADRVTAVAPLPFRAIEADMWWDDDPASPAYNTLRFDAPAAHPERLWRMDGVYDWIVPLGWNDSLPVPGLGSAIFLHVARPDFTPTAGCIAIAAADWPHLLAYLTPETYIDIRFE